MNNHHYLFATVGAISIMLNLFYCFYVLPGKDQSVKFWKKQAETWRSHYYKLLHYHNEPKKTDPGDFNPGPPPESEAGAN